MNLWPDIRSEVEDWDVITIGHLRWNRYFGENADWPPRGDPSTCTSTLVRGTDGQGKAYALLIDPTMKWTPPEFYFDLHRRTGLKPQAITHCYCTHPHLDHYDAFKYFPDARWLAAEPVAEALAKEAKSIDGGRVKGISGELFPGVFTVPLPGHAPALYGLAFLHRGRKILVAGDAVMTKHHFFHATTEYQPDPVMRDMAARTIADIKQSFDIVVPGHDNIIFMER